MKSLSRENQADIIEASRVKLAGHKNALNPQVV